MGKVDTPPDQSDVEAGDSSMRWFVRSRSGKGRYLVDLGAYAGNGRCSCKDFETRMEPLLRHMRLPAEGVEAGVLEVRDYMAGPWEACRCYHIYRARGALTDAFISTLKAAEAAHAASQK